MNEPLILTPGQHTRQGDVPVLRLDALPNDVTLEEVLPDGMGRLIVRHGEATGHVHCVVDPTVKVMRDNRGVLYVTAPRGFALQHLIGLDPTGEHATHEFGPGVYACGWQDEYTGVDPETGRDEFEQVVD